MGSPSTLGSAGAGAAGGSIFGPWGAAAGAVIGGIGGLISAGGAREAGEATGRMYDYRAGVALMNKQIATQNADYESKVGEVEAQESGMKTRARVGMTEAAQASSGLDVNRGSAVAVRESEVEIGQQDENIIRANAARRAYGYEVEATQDQAQSDLDRMAASQARIGGDISAVSSLLSAGTTVATRWSQFGQYYGNSPTRGA